MKLHEYQSKYLFSKFGIPIPRGKVANSASEVKQIANELGQRVVVKAQVLVGGRGKAGGIRLAKNSEEAENLATMILGMDLKGLPVRRVLVDEAIAFEREIYLAITNDRGIRKPIIIASAAGGIDIEQVALETPDKIIRVIVDPLLGLRDYQARDLAVSLDVPKPMWNQFVSICHGLWECYQQTDATLAEINPLVITANERLIALDGKMILDDNALFRHADLAEMRDLDIEAPAELEARKYGLSFIKLDGEIGCLVNGAGLAMATMDIIKLYGGTPANFLDIGGGASSEKVSAALRIILLDQRVRTVLINIFGGITRCDEVANGIISALGSSKSNIPIVIRLVGTNAEEGLKLLADANFLTADTLTEAALKSVELSKETTIEHPDR